MGLSDIFKKAAQTGFTIFDDVTTTCVYTSKGVRAYNAATGAVTSSDTDYSNVKIVFAAYNNLEIDDKVIKRTHVKALIPVDNLTPVPKIEDNITNAAGITYSIIGIKKDPADALYTFQCEPLVE